MIVSKIIKLLRKVVRIFSDALDQIKFRLSLVLNNVHHQSIRSFGFPYIAVSPNGSCVLGDNFRMSNGVRFNPIGFPQPCQIVVTDGAELIIGKNVGMSQAAIICHHSITIGDNVKIGGGVKIYDTNFHSLNPEIRRIREWDMREKKCRPVVIEHDAFIGAGAIILSGVTIGDNSIVAAGSVVSKSIPANEIWGGNPARFIKKVET